MIWYIIKLIVLLPMIGALAWGSLKLAQKLQNRVHAHGGPRTVRVIETLMLGPGQKLAVIEFRGREILVSASRNGLTRLAEAPATGVEA